MASDAASESVTDDPLPNQIKFAVTGCLAGSLRSNCGSRSEHSLQGREAAIFWNFPLQLCMGLSPQGREHPAKIVSDMPTCRCRTLGLQEGFVT
jgi:hypothetical protein